MSVSRKFRAIVEIIAGLAALGGAVAALAPVVAWVRGLGTEHDTLIAALVFLAGTAVVYAWLQVNRRRYRRPDGHVRPLRIVEFLMLFAAVGQLALVARVADTGLAGLDIALALWLVSVIALACLFFGELYYLLQSLEQDEWLKKQQAEAEERDLQHALDEPISRSTAAITRSPTATNYLRRAGAYVTRARYHQSQPRPHRARPKKTTFKCRKRYCSVCAAETFARPDLDDLRNALADCDKAVEIDPGLADARRLRADVLTELGFVEEAQAERAWVAPPAEPPEIVEPPSRSEAQETARREARDEVLRAGLPAEVLRLELEKIDEEYPLT